jgi:hypothetical protein
MSLQTLGARRGVTLRHWTTDSSWLGGANQRPSLALSDWDLAGGRQRNLIASMLTLVKTKPASTDRRSP